MTSMLTHTGIASNTMQHLKLIAPNAQEKFGYCEIHKSERLKAPHVPLKDYKILLVRLRLKTLRTRLSWDYVHQNHFVVIPYSHFTCQKYINL